MERGATDPIRQAVATGEFRKALALWNQYAAGLREELSRGQLSQGDFDEAGALVKWCRLELLCVRARALERLNRLRVAAEYAAPPPPRGAQLIRTTA